MTVRACFTLPEGNDTERPYPLSIHGAWMLKDGIQQYVESTRKMYAHGLLDAGECWLCVETAITEATKLRDWMAEVEPTYLVDSIKELDALIVELAADKERFLGLYDEERERDIANLPPEMRNGRLTTCCPRWISKIGSHMPRRQNRRRGRHAFPSFNREGELHHGVCYESRRHRGRDRHCGFCGWGLLGMLTCFAISIPILIVVGLLLASRNAGLAFEN